MNKRLTIPLNWYQSTLDMLEQQIIEQHLGQTLLFDYDEGGAAVEIANWTATRLLCQSDTTNKPCGYCHSCKMMSAHSHSDFYLLEPSAVSIGVDQVRALQEWAVQTPSHGRAKVTVISQVGKLTTAAANALLKVLEEPKAHSYFILLKPRQTALLATILSRSQRLIIHAPDPNQALGWLQQQLPDTPNTLQQLALHWLNDANQVCDFLHADGAKQIEQFCQAFNTLIQQGNIEPLHEQISTHRDQLQWLGQVLIDSMHTKLTTEQLAGPSVAHLDSLQLMGCYQQFVDLQQQLNTNVALNLSLQLYPLLLNLIETEEPSAH
ncbi:hypothetical protein [Celerinatantimonas yamalensis]|uniref:DNA-directed DNA polymerase n=1 Tax=Celerinatantimonas yamalensis TaxID=559956 RepID=A0ABW9G2Z4_9GAMM